MLATLRNKRVPSAARWMIRRAFGGATLRMQGETGGSFWFRPAEYPSLLKGIRHFEPNVREQWQRLLLPREVIYDIGANIGLTVVRFLALSAGDCRIVAFEPLPRNLGILRRNTLAVSDRVSIVEAAVGDHDGIVAFEDNLRHGGLSRLASVAAVRGPGSYLFRERNTIEVAVVTLDSQVARAKIPPPTLIKLDVEGAGGMVLAGAQDVLGKHRPAVCVSFHGDRETREVSKALREHGYRGVCVSQGTRSRWLPSEQIPEYFVHPSDEPRVRRLGLKGTT